MKAKKTKPKFDPGKENPLPDATCEAITGHSPILRPELADRVAIERVALDNMLASYPNAFYVMPTKLQRELGYANGVYAENTKNDRIAVKDRDTIQLCDVIATTVGSPQAPEGLATLERLVLHTGRPVPTLMLLRRAREQAPDVYAKLVELAKEISKELDKEPIPIDASFHMQSFYLAK